jgi:hypothetical protein
MGTNCARVLSPWRRFWREKTGGKNIEENERRGFFVKLATSILNSSLKRLPTE